MTNSDARDHTNTIGQLNAALGDRYRIEREIGHGGMATVFLARDKRHDRPVALKLLNPELGAVLGVERFLSEIRVTANLQHPNLLPLFDSGEANGLLFYVMPFVEGESLRTRLLREKQLPIDEALRLAAAIGSALDYAHRHDVIHRDLKPENILLHEGQPLVADFGIALAVSNAGGARVTQTGLSLGTPQYMSPEQATADRAIDGRTDIYSLGAVLYEMLTGEPPHSGTTAQAIIARVLTEHPRSMRKGRPSVPEHIEWAVSHALEKLPADRFATASEFATALASHATYELTHDSTSGRHAARDAHRPTSAIRRVTRFFAAAVVVAIAVISGFMIAKRVSRDQDSIAFLLEPPDIQGVRGRFYGSVRISPDGQTVGFAVTNDTLSQLFVRHLSDVASHPLIGTEDVFDLFFSPDGQTVGFTTNGGLLRRVPVGGGAVTTLANVPNFYTGGSWGSRGDQPIVIGMQNSGGALLQMSSSGGPLSPITKAQPTLHALPFVHPDGETLLFVDWGPGNSEDDFLAIGSRTSGQFKTTNLLVSQPIGVIDNYAIVLTADGSIKAAPFDKRTHELTGHAIIIDEKTVVPPMGNGNSSSALSASGALAYLEGAVSYRLLLSDSAGSRILLNDPRAISNATLSPDGRRIAASLVDMRGDTAVSDIYVFDIGSHTLSRFTNVENADQPAWTTDGKAIVYHTWYQTRPTVWRQSIDGGTPEKLLELPSGSDLIRNAFLTPDNRHLVVLRDSVVTNNGRLFVYSLDNTDRPTRIAQEASNLYTPAISPDGRWVAYSVSETPAGLPRMFVGPVEGSGRRVQISSEPGERPVWSRDGRRLYYQTQRGIEVATLTAAGASIEVVNRTIAFQNSRGVPFLDVSADGKHILTVQQNYDNVRLEIVTNWAKHARERIAASRLAK